MLASMAFPREHWTRLYSTNVLERLNREVKRCTDGVGAFPHGRAVIRLVGAVLLELDDEWHVGPHSLVRSPCASSTPLQRHGRRWRRRRRARRDWRRSASSRELADRSVSREEANDDQTPPLDEPLTTGCRLTMFSPPKRVGFQPRHWMNLWTTRAERATVAAGSLPNDRPSALRCAEKWMTMAVRYRARTWRQEASHDHT